MLKIDLTHTLSPDVPTFDLSCGFNLEQVVDYSDCQAPNLFRVQRINMVLSAGTHMDAPAHCCQGAKTIDQLELDQLITDLVVIRVDHDADENYQIMPEVVTDFELRHGKIKAGSFVIFYTGWDQYWPDRERYHNQLQFPNVHESTAKLLLERDIAGLGTDTLSADAGGKDFPTHRVILGAGKYLVENIANAKDLPPVGARVLVLPIKIKEGTEAPVRLVAMT